MAATQQQDLKVIVFSLGAERYGVDVEQVDSIERLQKPARVPHTAPYVKGVVNLRGVIVPVVDLRTRFELPDDETEASRMVVVTTRGMQVGMIVDAANDVADLAADSIEPPPVVVGGIEAEYLRGVAKVGEQLLILLNLDRLFSDEEVRLMGSAKR